MPILRQIPICADRGTAFLAGFDNLLLGFVHGKRLGDRPSFCHFAKITIDLTPLLGIQLLLARLERQQLGNCLGRLIGVLDCSTLLVRLVSSVSASEF